MPKPNAAFLALLAVGAGAILNKEWVQAGNDPANDMMGTGPFKLDDRQPGVHIKLVRNENYFVSGRPFLDKITLMIFPDNTARIAALRTNAVDIMDFVPQSDMAALQENGSLTLYTEDKASVIMFAMRQDREPLGNVKVRQALASAVDREALLKSALFGRGAVLTGGPLLTPVWSAAPELKQPYGYDPQRAKQLLAEAGVPNGFKTSITTTSSFAMHQNAAVTMQAGFRAIGVDAELQAFDTATWKQKQVSGDFDIMQEVVIVTYADPDFLWSFFHSQSFWGKNLKASDVEASTRCWTPRGRARTVTIASGCIRERSSISWKPSLSRRSSRARSVAPPGTT